MSENDVFYFAIYFISPAGASQCCVLFFFSSSVSSAFPLFCDVHSLAAGWLLGSFGILLCICFD